MRTGIPAPLLAHMQGRNTTLAWGLKLTRTDERVFGFTSHDRPADIAGTLYRADLGLDVASLVSSSGFAVDNTEVQILADGLVFTKPDLMAGIWDAARFELFRYNWATPSMGRAIEKRGRVGNIRPRRGAFVAELRTLRQMLQQQRGTVTQPTCRNRLGDARCGVNLDGSPGFTVSGTLTAVTSGQIVRDAARTEVAHWFTEGEITFVTGASAGLRQKVKSYAADGTITLALPLVFGAAPGDAYTMTAGCTRRLLEDCRDKFGNALNFWGEPHLVGVDAISSTPDFS